MGFLRAGVLGFGGGVVCLPLMQREAVDTYGWLTNDEFSEIVAITNTLPGPINTKVAGYIGYRVGGVIGAFIAVVASVLPSAIALVILLETLANFRDHPVVSGMTNAIVPVVGVMIALMSWQFLDSAAKEMRWSVVLMNVLIVAILIVALDLHPAIVVGVMIAIALFKPERKDTKEGLK